MSEEKKTGRWVRSLRKAGLIDPMEDSWELLDVEESDDPAIVVGRASTEPPSAPTSTQPPSTPASVASSSSLSKSEKTVDIVAATRTTEPVLPEQSNDEKELRRQMNHRFDIADYTGALEAAEKLLNIDEDAEDAYVCKIKCENTLIQMYESRIGSFKRKPSKAVSEEEIVWRNMDSTTAFIAANVDGTITFEEIIDISTVSRFDTCRILSQLLQEGIIK